MTAVAPRRAFLRGLVSLPLIGGGVSLIGSPTAVAEPVSRAVLAQYWNWLFYERRILCWELAGGVEAGDRALKHKLEGGFGGTHRALVPGHTPADEGLYWPDFHFPRLGSWTDVPKPSTRAALVMGAADFDWRPVPR